MNPYVASGMGGLGAGALSMLMPEWQNPADSAMGFMDKIPDQLKQYLGPYMEAGNRQLPGLEEQYGKLTNDPGGRLNEIGGGYHQSPGFQFALQQALQGADHAAAAGGMAGSPQHQQQNMGIATGLADQDYNQWLGNALGMYKMGMGGKQGLYDTGAKAGISMGEDLASVLAQKARLAYEGQNAQNQHDQGEWGAFLGSAGNLASMAFL